jgi:prepilin-type N-terminal cleavage/methylation domain-containing protein
MKQLLRRITKNQAGLTLIELMIALAITGIVTAAVTMLTFQVLDSQARANNHMDAINRVQNAGRLISQDASMAQVVLRTNDDDGFPLTLTWTDWADNEVHNVVYSIDNNQLLREYYVGDVDGSPDNSYPLQYVIGAQPDNPTVPVTYCQRDPTTNELTFTLTAIAGIGSQQVSETRQYKTIPRPIML